MSIRKTVNDMKENVFSRLKSAVSLLLAVIMLASFAACGRDVPAETTETPVTTEDPSFSLSDKWVVVRPDEVNDQEVKALQIVNRCLRSLYGGKVKTATDFIKPEVGIVPAEYEILIGRTNRDASVEANASLSGREGLYRVVNGNAIIITGGSPDATLEAAIAFVKDVYGYEEDIDAVTGAYSVKTPAAEAKLYAGFEGRVEVSFPKFIINGTDLCEFGIVKAASVKHADTFADSILELCGHRPDIIADTDYKGGPAIFLGYDPDADGGHCASNYDSYSYYICTGNGKIALDWKNTSIEKKVYDDFLSGFPEIKTGTAKITLPDGVSSGFTITGEYNHLTEVSGTSEQLASGVTYEVKNYKDGDGAPVVVYALTVEKDAPVRFYTGLPDDASSESSTVSTVMNTAKAIEGNGKKVIAGTNSGFFDMGATGLSRGLVVKEGKEVAENTSRPFFAQLSDGTVGLYASSGYAGISGKVSTAVAGNIILMKKGVITDVAPGTDMAVTRHPRTAIGIKPDGAVVLLVVDGRQSNISNGASYLDLVQLFREFGCTEALNLDGGGSTTMVIKQNGGLKLVNSPSGGTMRKVQDGLYIIEK